MLYRCAILSQSLLKWPTKLMLCAPMYLVMVNGSLSYYIKIFWIDAAGRQPTQYNAACIGSEGGEGSRVHFLANIL